MWDATQLVPVEASFGFLLEIFQSSTSIDTTDELSLNYVKLMGNKRRQISYLHKKMFLKREPTNKTFEYHRASSRGLRFQ